MSAERRVAIVTGGASGLGAAVAAALTERGRHVVVLDRQAAPGFDHEVVDLADSAAAEQAASAAAARGRLEAVVTAAGVDTPGRLADVPRERWERVVAVNLVGTAAVIRATLPHLERNGGRIVTVASTLGMRALPEATAYCASKFGVIGFSRALAAELAGSVGVTMVVPGGMRTHFFDGRDEQYKPGPDAELADPDDVASAVLLALQQPPGVELRELVVATSTEPSWP